MENAPPFTQLQKNVVSHIKTVKSENVGRVKLILMGSVMKLLQKYDIEEE